MVRGREDTIWRAALNCKGIWNTRAREVKMEECGIVVSVVFVMKQLIVSRNGGLEFWKLINVFPFRILIYISAFCVDMDV